MCLSCVNEGYETIMKDTIIQLLQRTLNDRILNIRKELVDFCKQILISRLYQTNNQLIISDLQLISILIILYGDEIEDVSNQAYHVSF